MNDVVLTGMTFELLFDRIITSEHYIIPGGYTVLSDNRVYQFDFHMTKRSGKKGRKCEYDVTEFDEDYSLENNGCRNITKAVMEKAEFTEFFVYTGEYDDPVIYPVRVLSLTCRFSDGSTLCSENLLKSANNKLSYN